MPFDQLHPQVLKDGFLDIKGQKFTITELLTDGFAYKSANNRISG
jgi:hypothetical protein